jgi:glycerol-3-phosphate acyltransferase PlsX
MTIIAVDATGGADGSEEIIKAVAAVSRDGGILCHVIGAATVLRGVLARHDHDPRRVQLTDVTQSPTHPAAAPLPPRAAAMRQAVDLLQSGAADAVVTTGDFGDRIPIWLDVFPLLPGATCPALASFFPRRVISPGDASCGLLLDAGAAPRCRPRDYRTFALMGAAYYRWATTRRPRVGLLSVGNEAPETADGSPRSTALLGDIADGFDFLGRVDGQQLLTGEVDVVLTDGFTGNVLWKAFAGATAAADDVVRETARRHWRWGLGTLFLWDALQAIRRSTDPADYGPATLLGFPNLLITALDSTHAGAIAHTIRRAAQAVAAELTGEIEAALAPPAHRARPTALPLRRGQGHVASPDRPEGA